jgi:hypothetical protein
MSESMKSTVSISCKDLIRTPAPGSFTGRSIMLHHTDGNTVIAASRGLIAVGATESEALENLAKLVQRAERSAHEGEVKTQPLAKIGE